METLLDACCITPLEWDALLERRLSLDSVKLDERWFVEKEDALVTRHGWVRSHRLLLAKGRREGEDLIATLASLRDFRRQIEAAFERPS